MYRSNTYNLIPSQRTIYQLSPTKTLKPRIKSLQKIKVNRKGLPNDFFRVKTKSQKNYSQYQSLKMATQPSEFQEIQTTPKFQDSSNCPFTNKRQSKSEERIQIKLKEQKKSISPFIEKNKEVTFCNSFFKSESQRRPKIVDLKIKRDKGIPLNKPKQCKLFDSSMRNDLLQLMKQKKIEKQTHCYLLAPRKDQKKNHILPILKGKYPSAFGV